MAAPPGSDTPDEGTLHPLLAVGNGTIPRYAAAPSAQLARERETPQKGRRDNGPPGSDTPTAVISVDRYPPPLPPQPSVRVW
jgi:hypothetical protein